VNPDLLSEVLSSRVRLRIAGALSIRPRTLGELATTTGISVQGVLRHLKRLEELGLVEERKVPINAPKARRVYSAKGTMLGDYSSGDLVVVKATEKWQAENASGQVFDLERKAGELLVQRRRIRDEGKRLGRMIDDLADGQEALMAALAGMDLSGEERLVLEVIFTEDTVEEGVGALSKYYGIEDRRSIDKALAKVKHGADR
jgi:DNA-binding transcriptional ArsR family regulator